jgi:opacity protein-like surface antigen
MKQYKLLQTLTLTALFSTFTLANDNGFYIGVDTSIISFGDQSLKITNEDKSTKNYKDIESCHGDIKVGYQHFDGNRVELYYRHNELDTKAGDITTQTYGINYEWAFSSLSSETITPYLLIGFGGGEASSSKITAVDNAETGEGSFGLGIHYQYNKNVDFQIGYTATSTGFDGFDDEEIDKTSTIDQDKIMVGLSYKF